MADRDAHEANGGTREMVGENSSARPFPIHETTVCWRISAVPAITP